MATLTTPTKPTVGGDSGTWGTKLNDALDQLEANIEAVNTDASAALPKAGGTMTGRLDAKTGTMLRVDRGSVSGTVTLDVAAGNCQTLTITGTATMAAPTNTPSGAVVSGLILRMTNGGAFTVTWSSAFKFPSGAAPVLTTSGKDDLAFLSWDNGTTWELVGIQRDVR